MADDLFKDLKKEQNEIIINLEKKRASENKKRLEKIVLCNQYNSMVTDVLKQLFDAVYVPREGIYRQGRFNIDPHCYWYIEEINCGKDNAQTITHVEVKLKLDRKGIPVGFVCCSHFYPSWCDTSSKNFTKNSNLTKEDLAKALESLVRLYNLKVEEPKSESLGIIDIIFFLVDYLFVILPIFFFLFYWFFLRVE